MWLDGIANARDFTQSIPTNLKNISLKEDLTATSPLESYKEISLSCKPTLVACFSGPLVCTLTGEISLGVCANSIILAGVVHAFINV